MINEQGNNNNIKNKKEDDWRTSSRSNEKK